MNEQMIDHTPALEAMCADIEAMGWTVRIERYRDFPEARNAPVDDNQIVRVQAELRYYGTFTVYPYGRVYWTAHDGGEEVEFSDMTWPVVLRIKQWLDERYPPDDYDDTPAPDPDATA